MAWILLFLLCIFVATYQATLPSTAQQVSSVQDQAEETAFQDSNSDNTPQTPPSKSVVMGSSVSSASSAVGSIPTGNNTTIATPARNLAGGSTASAIFSGLGYIEGVMENAPASVSLSLANLSSPVKEDDAASFSGHRLSPALTEMSIGKGIGRGSVVSGVSSQVSGVSLNFSSGSGLSSNGALGTVPAISDMAKRNILGADERIGSGAQPIVSPPSNRMLLQQVSKTIDGTGSTDSNNIVEGATMGRAFAPSSVSGVQWRPQSPSSFQNQNEMVCSLSFLVSLMSK